MKLTQLSIRNFKSIKSLNLTFPASGILVLVGENNAGKSNIIRAIDAVCGDAWYGKGKEADSDYYRRSRENNIEIEMDFSNGHNVRLKQPDPSWGMNHTINGSKLPWGSKGIKELFPCTYLSADRDFDKQMGMYDYTLLGRIRKAFHSRVTEVPGLTDEMKERFGDLMGLFDQVPGFAGFKSDFAQNFEELFPHNSGRMQIDFKAFTPRNLFNSIQIIGQNKQQPDIPQDLSELGEGAKTLILISLLQAYAKNFKGNAGELNGIIALEEPELFLHPQAQRHLSRALRDLARSGYQVIISTHSDAFLDTEFFDEIGRVVKANDVDCPDHQCTELITCSIDQLVDKCIESGVPHRVVTHDSIREYYKTTSNPKLNEAFFARLLVLVEGETEEMALKEYLLADGVDCDALGISIVGVSGKNQIPKYWRLFTAFKIPTIVVFDDDHPKKEAKKANENLAKCFQIDATLITAEGELCVFHTVPESGAKFFIVEQDFENAVKKELGEQLYEQYRQEAKEVIKPERDDAQKGVMARYIARKSISERNFIPKAARILASEIKQMLGIVDLPQTELQLESTISEGLPF